MQSPYWTQRLRELVRHQDLEVVLLLERGRFAHRPDWAPQPVEGLTIEVLGSSVMRSMRKGDDLGYQIEGVRSIPWRLPIALARLRPDVVIVCNATQLLLALIGRWILRFRLALIVEDTLHATRNLGVLTRLSRAWAYRQADLRFAFSADAGAYLEAIGAGTRVTRTSWSLDMPNLRVNPNQDSPRDVLGVQRDSRQLTVLFAGRLVEGKGIRHLLQSWSELPRDVKRRAKLVIAGNGPLVNEATEFIRKSSLNEVEMLGNVPYEEMMRRFALADLFVLPTLQDLFSLTVLEAMASGCPVITTPFNGARELLEDGKTGWIVDPTEPGHLTRALATALSGGVDLTTMGRAARERVSGMDNRAVMWKFADDLRALAPDRA